MRLGLAIDRVFFGRIPDETVQSGATNEAPGSPQELRAGDQGHSGLSGPLTALGSAQGLE